MAPGSTAGRRPDAARQAPRAERFRQLAEATLAAFPRTAGYAAIPCVYWNRANTGTRCWRCCTGSAPIPTAACTCASWTSRVDSKFIEQRRARSASCWTALPSTAIDAQARGARAFSRRYGLRDKPLRIRLRILDPRRRSAASATGNAGGATGRTAAPAGYSSPRTRPMPWRFPRRPGASCCSARAMRWTAWATSWLHRCPLHYWGDIDTHGFAILDRLRAHSPGPLTADGPRNLAGTSPALGRRAAGQALHGHTAAPDDAELALFEDLRDDRLGQRIRLEQEHIRFGWLERALRGCTASGVCSRSSRLAINGTDPLRRDCRRSPAPPCRTPCLPARRKRLDIADGEGPLQPWRQLPLVNSGQTSSISASRSAL